MPEKLTELILIRHAEAEGQGGYLGRRSNPLLSEKGHIQAESLRENLFPVTAENGYQLFTSPMKRAVQTAEIAFPGLEQNIIDDFAEYDFGEWDGMLWQKISAAAESDYRNWLKDPVAVSPPGGETLAGFSRRVNRGIESLLKQSCGGTVYLVTHGGVIRTVLCSLIGLPTEKQWSFKIDCASFSCVQILDDEAGSRTAVIKYLNYK